MTGWVLAEHRTDDSVQPADPNHAAVLTQTMSSSGEIPVITTLEQWIRVATANPNHSTSCDLVELLGDTMELLLSSVLEKLQNKQFTDETMEAVVGNVVPEPIAQVLDVEDVGSKSTEYLNRLIVKRDGEDEIQLLLQQGSCG
ncbi:hypothetical protein XENOCAPTIV_023415 [Xenoophorus captivus]|uniref:Uncharacterized protein n=1 Tax=Xenoophorus captivus TaxID=1517983 RepID=A0ABV0QBZ2_9TELE